jgi:PTH1 family peptidyl-tRNA hydrolase
MFLIIGLGNPGEKYENTRHNVGFQILDGLKDKNNSSDFKFSEKFNAKISEGKIAKEKIIFAKPQTFMNHSGRTVKLLTKDCKLEAKNLIVIHDDIDLPFGRIKISKDSSSGGHRGVGSIIENLATKKFIRLRVGILPDFGKPEKVENFVLKKFTKTEEKDMKEIIEKSIEAIKLLLESGPSKAMNEFNQ